MSINKQGKVDSFSLAEILLSIALFIMLSSAVIFAAYDSNRLNTNNYQRINSSMYFDEYYNALVDSKNSLWAYLINNTNAGPKSLSYTNGKYNIVNGAQNFNGINISFIITDVYRDGSGNIVTSGGTLDLRSRKITLTGQWNDVYGNVISYSSDMYVNDWNTLELKNNTTADFTGGTNTNTLITTKVDGEVQLGAIFYPDWCKPTLGLNEYDLPGSAVSKTIFAVPGVAYLGTAGTSQTISLTKLNITGVNPPSISVESTFTGYQVNNIFVDGNYAYLATSTGSKEVVILDVSHVPYTEVGYFNPSGNNVANSVYVVGNVGYVAIGKKVMTFNLTAKTGSRAKLGEVSISLNSIPGKTSYVSQIVVRGNYLYASLYDDYDELAIANVTNPGSMTLSSTTSVNNQQTLDIYVSPDGTRTYFGTTASSSEREFFILNTTSKTTSSPIIGQYDSTGMSIDGIAIIASDHRAILVGTGGEEYQALDITDETHPVRCGGTQMDLGIYDVDTVTDALGNAFSYIVTADPAKEFKILRGGPGGGGSDGYGYPASGNYISNVLDSGSDNTNYYTIRWTATVPSGGNLRIQLRSGTSSSNITSQTFVGPDGTSGTYFTSSAITSLPSVLNNKRYFQYKVYFDSDTFSTPVLSDITFNYQK